MASATTTTLDSTIREFIENKFYEDFSYDMPLFNFSTKHPLQAHEGKTYTFPSMAQLGIVQDIATEGSNPSAAAVYSSGVKAELLEYHADVQISRKAVWTALEATVDNIISTQMLQAKRSIHLHIAKICRWGGVLLRADGNTNYENFGTSTSDGSTPNFIVDSTLVNDNDRFNGGQMACYSGSGQGQARPVYDYTGSTGSLITDATSGWTTYGSGHPLPPYNAFPPFATDSSTQTSYNYVSTPQLLGSGDTLSTPLILLGQFYHNEKFHTQKMSGPMSHKLFITQYGRNDLLGADNLFQQAIRQYKGEGFSNPDRSFYEWFGTEIDVMSEGFRSVNTSGSNACAVYDATGSVHYYPMFGKYGPFVVNIEPYAGDQPGGLNFWQVWERDSNNPKPAYYLFGWDTTVCAAIPYATNCINLCCGNPQS